MIHSMPSPSWSPHDLSMSTLVVSAITVDDVQKKTHDMRNLPTELLYFSLCDGDHFRLASASFANALQGLVTAIGLGLVDSAGPSLYALWLPWLPRCPRQLTLDS